jgi:hypothetical protein
MKFSNSLMIASIGRMVFPKHRFLTARLDQAGINNYPVEKG